MRSYCMLVSALSLLALCDLALSSPIHSLYKYIRNEDVANMSAILSNHKSDADYQLILNNVFVFACKVGNLEIIENLLRRGASPHFEDDASFFTAVSSHRDDVISLLLKHSIDVHSNNDKALKIACTKGYYSTIELLLKKGADIHANNDEPLLNVIRSNNLRSLELIIRSARNIYKYAIRRTRGQHGTKYALQRRDFPDCPRQNSADCSVAKEYCAIMKSDLYCFPVVKRAIYQISNDIFNSEYENRDILCQAIKSGSAPIVRYLIRAHGYPIHQYDELPLELAVRFGHTNVVTILVRHGADAFIDNDRILYTAIEYRRPLCFIALLQKRVYDGPNWGQLIEHAIQRDVPGVIWHMLKHRRLRHIGWEQYSSFVQTALAQNRTRIATLIYERGLLSYEIEPHVAIDIVLKCIEQKDIRDTAKILHYLSSSTSFVLRHKLPVLHKAAQSTLDIFQLVYNTFTEWGAFSKADREDLLFQCAMSAVITDNIDIMRFLLGENVDIHRNKNLLYYIAKTHGKTQMQDLLFEVDPSMESNILMKRMPWNFHLKVRKFVHKSM